MDNLKQRIANLSPRKRELLSKRLNRDKSSTSYTQIQVQSREVHSYPLSFAQQRLWFFQQLEPESPFYNIPIAIELTGELDIAVLTQSLDEIIHRHEILRTVFTEIEGIPAQIILPSLNLMLPVIDLQQVPENEKEAEIRHNISKETKRPFNMAQAPLLRAILLQTRSEKYILLLVMHHIITDSWSIDIFIRELTILYEAFSDGNAMPLPALPVQYADFAVWQREKFQGERLDYQISYWKRQLKDMPFVLELPIDRPRPAVQSFSGDAQSFILSRELTDGLRKLSQHEGCTLFMALLAAFSVILHRYTGQKDLVVGAPISNRTPIEVEELIGFFANTVILRIDLSDNPSFRELLRRVREVTLGAYSHQDLPFEKLVEILQPERDLSRSPLVQVMFQLQKASAKTFNIAELTLKPLQTETETAWFDIALECWEDAEILTGYFEYNKDLFNSSTIAQLSEHFQTLLRGINADPEQRLSDLPLLTEIERRLLLEVCNHESVSHLPDQCLHQLFEAQVELRAEATAVIFGEEKLTYRELNQRTNIVAHHLQSIGVGQEVFVGLSVERSLEMVVGLLAILKAGGTYVPLDPEYPDERLAFMLKDTQISVLLTQQRLVNRFLQFDVKMVCLDARWEATAGEDKTNPISKVTTENLAYIIYTSGSTGKPKGVCISHGAFLKHCVTIQENFHLRSNDRVLQFTSLSFDASLEQIFPTLLSGASLVLRGTEVWSTREFAQKVTDYRLTVVNIPPVYWHQLVKEYDTNGVPFSDQSLRLVIVGGDVISPDGVRTWLQMSIHTTQLLNAYGPTETTITSLIFDIPDSYAEELSLIRVPIGRPLAGRTIYILDQNGSLAPFGVPGELYIGGTLLARGYLRRPDLTAERFIPDPYSKEPGARLYRTGDMVRYRADGCLEFLGRLDHQIKIRGFRIEPGEIEAALVEHKSIREAIVVARRNKEDEKRLLAYVVTTQKLALTSNELRLYLKDKIPVYMIPETFVFLENLPLTPNGKVDRKALPDPDMQEADVRQMKAFVAPRTPVEEMLAEIWAQLLGLEKVGIYDNFFEIGGHSLIAAQIISRIRTTFQTELSIRYLFEHPTIVDMALAVRQNPLKRSDIQLLDKVKQMNQRIMLSNIEQFSDREVDVLLRNMLPEQEEVDEI